MAEATPPRSGPCPFCAGNEEQTPPEILAGRAPSPDADGPGWTYRVVPNMFPALRIEGDLEAAGEGLFDRMNGVGAHEVIIETPDHHASLATMSVDEVTDVLWAYRERILDLKKDPRFAYVLVFKNHGEAAGASLEHPHSQLIATPIIPIMVREELEGAADYYERKERCVWCDILRQERRAQRRLIAERGGFVALAPYAPRFPVRDVDHPRAPRRGLRGVGARRAARAGRPPGDFLRRMNRVLGQPAYNFMLHTAPLDEPDLAHFHWHLEIIPKLTRVAGFEWGSGFFINPVPPEIAAAALREEAE